MLSKVALWIVATVIIAGMFVDVVRPRRRASP